MGQKSNAPAVLALCVTGLCTMAAIQSLIAQGRPPQQSLIALAAICPVIALGLFLQSRILPRRTPAQKSLNWMIAFALLVPATLMISWQGLFRPVMSYDHMLGLALLLAAVGLGFLSIRSFLRMRTERALTDSQELAEAESPAASRGASAKSRAISLGILACLSLLISIQQMVWPFQNYERGLAWGGLILSILFGFRALRAHQNNDTAGLHSPKLGLAIAAVFGFLIVLGDVRFILRGNVQAGVIQMAVWLPITGYYGFREYGRVKRMKNG